MATDKKYRYQTQVWLPAAMKAQLIETGAGEKEMGLFECWPLGKTGDSCPKAHLQILVQAEKCIRRGRESRTKGSRCAG